MELLSILNAVVVASLAYVALLLMATRGFRFHLPFDLQLPPATPLPATPGAAAESSNGRTGPSSSQGSAQERDTKSGDGESGGVSKTEDRTRAVCSPSHLRQRPYVGMAGLERQNSDVNRRFSSPRHSE